MRVPWAAPNVQEEWNNRPFEPFFLPSSPIRTPPSPARVASDKMKRVGVRLRVQGETSSVSKLINIVFGFELRCRIDSM